MGGTGGAGGRGGNAAGAIYNAVTGNITVIDSVFGGRLSSGFIGEPNHAVGGRGGAGGQGGLGGGGGPGGEGAMGAFWDLDKTIVAAADPAYSGTPGAGGNGGSGGAAGTAGLGGNAAGNLINFGSITGNAAWGANGAASGGSGGTAGAGGQRGLGASPGDRLHFGSIPGIGSTTIITPGSTLGIASGSPGIVGAAGVSGAAGSADSNTLSFGGVQMLQTAESLIYVHNMGIDVGAGTLRFNILRIGDNDAKVSVKWKVEGNGPGGITAGDLKSPLSGVAILEPGTSAVNGYDLADSVENITLKLSASALAGAPKSFTITIGGLVVSNSTDTALGTSVATGFTTSDDAILIGTARADRLTGSGANNVILGADKNDRLFGAGGSDRIEGGEGADSLDGGSGLDSLSGGSGNDNMKGGDGNDTLAGDNGNDDLDGGKGKDTLIGGLDKDRLDGGKDKDTINGGVGRDELTGGLGNDVFQFLGLKEIGDTISDFHAVSGDNDTIEILASGFGGGLVAGRTLLASQFQTRMDNHAQDANDRFIFRTTDGTLWFDKDGKNGTAAAMVADLQAGAVLSSADISII